MMTNITAKPQTTEHQRLTDSEARRADWKDRGPYVSDVPRKRLATLALPGQL